MLNGLDLFSGIGGLSVALSPWVRPAAYCESEPYAQSVLLSRMRSGELHPAAIWDDVTTLRAEHIGTPEIGIDIIYGGFPCQDISVAGLGAGLEGERSGLFYEVARLITEIKPTFVFLENVPAIRTRGAEQIGKELSRRGYDCRWDVISAAEIGAPHLRKRWFLLAANAQRARLRDRRQWDTQGETKTNHLSGHDGPEKPLAHANANGKGPQISEPWWALEPDVGRVAHGIPHRVDRLRGLGNAVVPLQAQTAFKRLMGLT